jgi:maltose O-acetyltransferase
VKIGSPRLELGERVLINSDVILHNFGGIVIEDNVAIGPGALLTTARHSIGTGNRRQGKVVFCPIRVGAGSWIGARAVVLPGVTIGNGCVVGAGAVVTRDCAPNGLYMGVPARRVRDLPELKNDLGVPDMPG